MQLRGGFSFCVAPRFYSRLAWKNRLQLNSGVESDGCCFYPRTDWRQVSPAELALLVNDPTQVRGSAEATFSSSQISVLAIPNHVRAAWWTVAEQAALSGSDFASGNLDGYETFVTTLSEFLRFKRVPFPSRCSFEVVASQPAQRSTRVDSTTGESSGLGFNEAATITGPSRILGILNLGDEATQVVLLNLLPPTMRFLLTDYEQAKNATLSLQELAVKFFTTLPTYPLVRVQLDPGDGLWLPDCGVVYDGDTRSKQDIDIVLTIRGDTTG